MGGTVFCDVTDPVASITDGLAREPETRAAGGDHVGAVARAAAEEGADVSVVGARRAGT
jgi:hypothetical protein